MKQKCVLKSVSFLVDFFSSIFQFSVFTENGNFQFFLKSFPQPVLVLSHTLSNSFRLCKFKKLCHLKYEKNLNGAKILLKGIYKNIKILLM